VCVTPGVEVIRDESARTACQELFFQVTECQPDPKVSDPAQLACAHRAIAGWVAKNLNGDALDQEKAIIVAREVALVDGEGAPVRGAGGAPILKRLEACDRLTGTQRESCRALFVEVSTCRIKPHELAECPAGAACPREAVDAAIGACSRDAITAWMDEHPDLAKE
jgi:hypothetical protein